MTNLEILLDLYRRYTKKHLTKIFLSIFFSILVAGSTAMIAYLLDPAIEKIFIEKNQKLMLIIPIIILITFAVKGTSLYLAKTLLIQVGGEVQKVLQLQIMQSILKSNVESIDSTVLIDLISEGKVIFNKSEPNQKPCGVYYIETDSLNFIITNCEAAATVEIK